MPVKVGTNISIADALKKGRAAKLARYHKQRKYGYECSIRQIEFQPLILESTAARLKVYVVSKKSIEYNASGNVKTLSSHN